MSEKTTPTAEIITESNNVKELKENVVSFLEFAFKVGLGIGSVIAFCFCFFYVEVMPSIGNIGDITIFLVMVAGVGILIALFVLFLLPALMWNDKNYEKYLEHQVSTKVIILFFLFSLYISFGWHWYNRKVELYLFDYFFIFFVGLSCFGTWLYPKNWRKYLEYSISIPVVILFLLRVFILNSIWMMAIMLYPSNDNRILSTFLVVWWLINLVLPTIVLCYTLKSQKDKMMNIMFVMVSLVYSLFISLYVFVSLYNFGESIELLFYSVVFIGFVTFLNIVIVKAVLKNFKPETSEQNKNFYRWLPMVSSLIVVWILSFILVYQKQDVFFITKPFELLKLGHYKATLQFKEDFIQKDNPFSKSNLNNCKEGQFFIHSSIGDEYILEELEEHVKYNEGLKENNNTKKVQFRPAVYRIKKEFVLAESKPSFDANDTNKTNTNKTWLTDSGCDSYEKVIFKKEFISNNNPFIENEKGCLTKTFWVRDRGATLELKNSNNPQSEPYQIPTKYIMSRQKVQDQNTTWTNCLPQSKNDK